MGLCGEGLTLYQRTKFQTPPNCQRNCRHKNKCCWNEDFTLWEQKTLWEKKQMLLTSIFSFSYKFFQQVVSYSSLKSEFFGKRSTNGLLCSTLGFPANSLDQDQTHNTVLSCPISTLKGCGHVQDLHLRDVVMSYVQDLHWRGVVMSKIYTEGVWLCPRSTLKECGHVQDLHWRGVVMSKIYTEGVWSCPRSTLKGCGHVQDLHWRGVVMSKIYSEGVWSCPRSTLKGCRK